MIVDKKYKWALNVTCVNNGEEASPCLYLKETRKSMRDFAKCFRSPLSPLIYFKIEYYKVHHGKDFYALQEYKK